MKGFHLAKWIWVDKNFKPDIYGEFYDELYWDKDNAICRISCDSDYVLYVNGKYVASNQYGDFEWYKSYDEIDVTTYLKSGKNAIAILVWHFGKDSQRYKACTPGLIFEISSSQKILLSSSNKTLSRYSKTYKQGLQKPITQQMGFSFCFDANRKDDWVLTGKGFKNSVLVNKQCEFILRPIKKLTLKEKIEGKLIKSDKKHYLFDFGEEVVGLISLDFVSNHQQTITVAWGESLTNGQVRRVIDNRDFSFTYIASEGDNNYVNYMLRLGCRYIEIYSEEEISINCIAIIPQIVPIKENTVKFNNEIDQKIYDACVNTLKLCMMEHYVDTPWREQCLYVYDSRNQAFCGYKAFKNGNIDYVKANLKLISQDRRKDGLLSICYPCGADLTIPSFSLYYFLQVREYLSFTSDVGFGNEVYGKLISLLDTFIKNRKDGLVLKFEGVHHWNFYDWSPHLEGALHATEENIPDLIINLLFILALLNLKEIDKILNKTFGYEHLLSETKRRVREEFYNKEKGLFSITKCGNEYTVLGNSLAILTGVVSKTECVNICEKIANSNLVDCSLSMKIFKYDALLLTDKQRWSSWILDEIRREYGKMLHCGSTTVWETIEGADAFKSAGSLCHGWSAIPIYYYHIFKENDLV